MTWPISFDDVLAARDRIAPYLPPTPARRYAPLDAAVGHGIAVWVKHDNHQPTNAFKVRNGMSALTRLSPEQRRRGVIAATRGNHGLGLAWAGGALGIPVVICVPRGNNPDKNEALRGLGVELCEDGRDYDEAVDVALRIADARGLHMVHSTNDRDIIAGAGTLALELFEQVGDLDALVMAVGGGSQAVGAITVARALRPGVAVYGVQAAAAPAIHDGWRRREKVSTPTADTMADGLATRHCYDLTFPALCEGLADFVTLGEPEIAAAVRLAIRTTHNLVEPAGAAGLGGLCKLASALAGRRVGVVFSGGNIDESTLASILAGC